MGFSGTVVVPTCAIFRPDSQNQNRPDTRGSYSRFPHSQCQNSSESFERFFPDQGSRSILTSDELNFPHQSETPLRFGSERIVREWVTSQDNFLRAFQDDLSCDRRSSESHGLAAIKAEMAPGNPPGPTPVQIKLDDLKRQETEILRRTKRLLDDLFTLH